MRENLNLIVHEEANVGSMGTPSFLLLLLSALNLIPNLATISQMREISLFTPFSASNYDCVIQVFLKKSAH